MIHAARMVTSMALALCLAACGGGGTFAGGGSKASPKKEKREKKEGDALPERDRKLGNEAVDDGVEVERASDEEKPTQPAEEEEPEVATTAPPGNPTVTTAGSFTAWAEPANPGQLQPYAIFIEVKLPSSATAYTMQDLSGSLSGTDGYDQSIPVDGSPFAPAPVFSFVPGQARLKVMVPGAFIRSTTDTIQIRSALLKEAQSLTVRFQ